MHSCSSRRVLPNGVAVAVQVGDLDTPIKINQDLAAMTELDRKLSLDIEAFDCLPGHVLGLLVQRQWRLLVFAVWFNRKNKG